MDTDKILIATFFCLIVHSIICLLKYFEDIHELGEKNSDQTTHSWTFSRVSISGRIAYILTWYKHSWCFSRLLETRVILYAHTESHFQYADPPKIISSFMQCLWYSVKYMSPYSITKHQSCEIVSFWLRRLWANNNVIVHSYKRPLLFA